MIALVVQNDPDAAAATTAQLMRIGFQVMTVESLRAAEAMAKIGVVDLLIAEERVQGGLTHRLILSTERRNPGLTAIMLTPKTGEDADELFLLMPAISALLPIEADADTVAKFVGAGIAYASDNLHRRLEDDTLVPLLNTPSAEVAAPVQVITPIDPGRILHDAPLSKAEDLAPQVQAPFQSIRTPVMH